MAFLIVSAAVALVTASATLLGVAAVVVARENG